MRYSWSVPFLCSGLIACTAATGTGSDEMNDGGAKSATGGQAAGTGGATTVIPPSSGGASTVIPPSSGGSSTVIPPGTGASTSVVDPPDPVACQAATGSDALIDDLEDNDQDAPIEDQRNGKWAVAADDAGSLAGAAGEVVPKDGEYCLSASGHDEWGANLSLYFREPRSCYDASVYSGVCFRARGDVSTYADGGGTTDGTVVFAISTSATEGDNKDVSGNPLCTSCNAHYQVDVANADLDPDNHQEFCFSWDELKTQGDAPKSLTESNDLWHLEWKLPRWEWDDVAHSVDGTICIDEVWFQE